MTKLRLRVQELERIVKEKETQVKTMFKTMEDKEKANMKRLKEEE